MINKKACLILALLVVSSYNFDIVQAKKDVDTKNPEVTEQVQTGSEAKVETKTEASPEVDVVEEKEIETDTVKASQNKDEIEEVKANKETIDKARKAISQKDYQFAIEYLSAYIASKPKKYEIYKLRGECYYALRRYDLAEKDFLTAINLKAGNDKFVTNTKYLSAVVLGVDTQEQLQNPELGNLYGQLMYAQKALNNPFYENSYSNAVKYNSHIYLPYPKKDDITKINCPQKYGKLNNPQGVDALIQSVIIDIENGNFNSAQYKIPSIIQSAPIYYLGYYLSGVVLSNVSQEEEALESFKTALEYNPYDFESMASIGQIYYNNAEKTFNKNDIQKSIKYFKEALKYNPNCNTYYFYIGLNNLLMKDYSSAVDNFNSAVKLKNNDYNSLYYKLIAQYLTGKYSDVEIGATNLLYKRVSNYNSVRYLRALAKFKQGKLNDALSDIENITNDMSDIYNIDIKVLSSKEKALISYLYYLKSNILQQQGLGTKTDMEKALENPVIAGFVNKDKEFVISNEQLDTQYDFIRETFDNYDIDFSYINPDYKVLLTEKLQNIAPQNQQDAGDNSRLVAGEQVSIAEMLATHSIPSFKSHVIMPEEVVTKNNTNIGVEKSKMPVEKPIVAVEKPTVSVEKQKVAVESFLDEQKLSQTPKLVQVSEPKVDTFVTNPPKLNGENLVEKTENLEKKVDNKIHENSIVKTEEKFSEPVIVNAKEQVSASQNTVSEFQIVKDEIQNSETEVISSIANSAEKEKSERKLDDSKEKAVDGVKLTLENVSKTTEKPEQKVSKENKSDMLKSQPTSITEKYANVDLRQYDIYKASPELKEGDEVIEFEPKKVVFTQKLETASLGNLEQAKNIANSQNLNQTNQLASSNKIETSKVEVPKKDAKIAEPKISQNAVNSVLEKQEKIEEKISQNINEKVAKVNEVSKKDVSNVSERVASKEKVLSTPAMEKSSEIVNKKIAALNENKKNTIDEDIIVVPEITSIPEHAKSAHIGKKSVKTEAQNLIETALHQDEDLSENVQPKIEEFSKLNENSKKKRKDKKSEIDIDKLLVFDENLSVKNKDKADKLKEKSGKLKKSSKLKQENPVEEKIIKQKSNLAKKAKDNNDVVVEKTTEENKKTSKLVQQDEKVATVKVKDKKVKEAKVKEAKVKEEKVKEEKSSKIQSAVVTEETVRHSWYKNLFKKSKTVSEDITENTSSNKIKVAKVKPEKDLKTSSEVKKERTKKERPLKEKETPSNSLIVNQIKAGSKPVKPLNLSQEIKKVSKDTKSVSNKNSKSEVKSQENNKRTFWNKFKKTTKVQKEQKEKVNKSENQKVENSQKGLFSKLKSKFAKKPAKEEGASKKTVIKQKNKTNVKEK